MIRRQFRVSGKVQGVWFRAGTREQAQLLGLTGHAANLADGSVEVEAQGDAALVDKLQEWLQHGPRLAKVADVSSTEIELKTAESGFRIL